MKKGFTLIELVMVLLVVAIIAVIASTRITSLTTIRARTAAYKIKSDIRYAQSYALATQQRTKVDFNASQESYGVYYEQTPNADDWAIMTDPLTRKNFTVDLTQTEFSGANITGTNFDGTNYDLAFDKASTPWSYNPSDDSETQLSSEGSVSLSGGISVTVQPNTGKVEIE